MQDDSKQEAVGRPLFIVIRFDAFQMAREKKFDPSFVTIIDRYVYDHLEDAETEAARLNLQAAKGVHYFTRRLVNPFLSALLPFPVGPSPRVRPPE